MTITSLEVFRPRAIEALARITRSAEIIMTLLQDARAVSGALVAGEPQLIRDLEFDADDMERLADLARRKLLKEN